MAETKELELTQEFIDTLAINEDELLKKIADELEIKFNQVKVTVEMFKEGNTVPFISRYRKERTGNLDEIKVRGIEQKFNSLSNLETRKLEIVKGIFSQGLLDRQIYTNVMKSASLTEVEELYAPYKKKKKTRAMVAIEKGLTKLADLMEREKNIDIYTESFIDPEKGVNTKEEALQGAMDIVAERISQDVEFRKKIKEYVLNNGFITVQGSKEKEKSVYGMYYEFKSILNNLKAHHVMGINRGENEDELKVKFEYDNDYIIRIGENFYRLNNGYHREALEDSLKRLIMPSVLREIRSDLTKGSEDNSIQIFAKNLKDLLMQPPIKKSIILGMDPGIRTGTKSAIIDENGKFTDNFVIYQHKKEEAEKTIAEKVKKYKVQLIAIGNGTGSHEVQTIVADTIEKYKLDVRFTVVPEDGASVYSASEIASEEFPDLDLTIRGAISIGRRLQDPLAELVKIDPKAIGVGLYQHDVNQKSLSEMLDNVVESVVNQVGVNLNTASAPLLKYISGITSSVAKNIVQYREKAGVISSRTELKKVKGLGEKAFEQAAGFLMIPESSNPLDKTWIHPENYALGKEIMIMLQGRSGLSVNEKEELKKKYGITDTTINDIVEALNRPGRDPREDYPQPLLSKGIINFEDLKEGMTVKGKVKNVVNFGAFIDIGIKETALLHVSQMSNKFVKDPMEVVKIGDVFDLKIIEIDRVRKRISLSLKK